MPLSISSRPTKTVGSSVCAFNSVHRPMKYVLASDIFPTNSVDTTYTVSGVASSDLGITVTTTLAHGYSEKEWVHQSGFSVSSYNGNFKILRVPTTTTYVIGVAYVSSDTGSTIKYYNNYFAQIEIYAGLPAYHAYQASKTLRLIDTVNIIPDEDGNVNLNVAPLLKQDIEQNYDNTIKFPDYNQVTACYIKYREVYDVVSGGDITSTPQTQTTDVLSGCTPSGEIVTGGDFTGGYSDFDLVSDIVDFLYGGFDAQWVYGTNNMQVTLPSIFDNSSEIKQDIDFSPGFNYDLTMDVSQSGFGGFVHLYVYDSGTGLYERLHIQYIAGGNVSINFTPSRNYDQIRIFATTFDNNTITIDNLSIEASDCNFYVWAVNAITGFNHDNGGNLASYVVNRSILTDSISNSPILFPDYPFFESYIIPNAIIENLSNSGTVVVRLKELDQNSVQLSETDLTVTNGNDGIYHRRLNDQLAETTSKKGKVQLVYLPDNLLTVADGGDFESTFASWNSFFGYLGVSSFYGASADYANTGTQSFGLRDGNFTISASGSYIAYYNQGFSLEPNSSYDFIVYFLVDGGGDIRRTSGTDTVLKISLGDQAGNAVITEGLNLYIGNISGTNQGFDTLAFSRNTSVFNNDPPTGELAHEQWIQLTAVFSNNTASPITVKPGIFLDGLLANTGFQVSGSPTTYFMYTDTWVFKGPKINLTNERTFLIDRDCKEQNYPLMWLNNKGGYDSYNFSARKLNSVDITGEEIYRNPENSWDTGFINNKFAHDFIKVNARNKWTVRSKPLTISEYEALEQVLYSPKVYKLNNANGSDMTGVNVVKSSIRKFEDKEKLIVMSFEVQETDFRPIQSQ